jgi:hypothetical protein
MRTYLRPSGAALATSSKAVVDQDERVISAPARAAALDVAFSPDMHIQFSTD